MNHIHRAAHRGQIGCQIDLDESMSYHITWDVILNEIASGNAVSSRREHEDVWTMPFIPFHEAFPDLAAQETRTITTLASAYLPAGSYTLIEMYCDEPHCDCRRVFFSVLSSNTLQIETVIAYGWESPAFYAQWMGDDDPETIRGLKGPILNFGSPHSALAPALLDLVKTAVLQDDHYIARLKTHYAIFRQTIDAKRKGRMSQRRSTSPRRKLTNAQNRQRTRQHAR